MLGIVFGCAGYFSIPLVFIVAERVTRLYGKGLPVTKAFCSFVLGLFVTIALIVWVAQSFSVFALNKEQAAPFGMGFVLSIFIVTLLPQIESLVRGRKKGGKTR